MEYLGAQRQLEREQAKDERLRVMAMADAWDNVFIERKGGGGDDDEDVDVHDVDGDDYDEDDDAND